VTTTNNKRIILRKRGEPISKSAKSNYPLWKLAETLSLSELTMLMTKRKHDIKYENSSANIGDMREEILLLNDAYKIKKRDNLNIDKSESVIHIGQDEEKTISMLASDIIAKLNFSQNTLFREEVISIANKITVDIKDEILATCIVKEVLEKYNSKYNDEELLDIYQIPEILFYEFFTLVSLWCRRHYWKR